MRGKISRIIPNNEKSSNQSFTMSPWHVMKAWLYYTYNRAGENLYHCALCGEGFVPRNNLKRHMNSHAGNDSNLCALCGEEFVSWNRLKFQIKKLYWRKYVTRFSSSRSRNQQTRLMKIYVREILYHCALCSSKFKFSNNLKTIMKSHPGENPYHCTLCGKCFISWHHIKQHMKSHAGNNPYPCGLYNKKFIPTNWQKRQLKIETWESQWH